MPILLEGEAEGSGDQSLRGNCLGRSSILWVSMFHDAASIL